VDIDFKEHFKRYEPIFADKVANDKCQIRVLKDQKSIQDLKDGLIIGLGAGDITYQLRGES
jgi:UDP-N-acetylmuramate--alanine ligase